MKLVNPFWKEPDQQKADKHGAAVLAWLQANAGKRMVKMNELRAGLPAIAEDLSRSVVQQIAAQHGMEIDSPDTAE